MQIRNTAAVLAAAALLCACGSGEIPEEAASPTGWEPVDTADTVPEAGETEGPAKESTEDAAAATAAPEEVREASTLAATQEETLEPSYRKPLEETLSGMISGYPGTWSLYFKDTDSGAEISLGEGPMVAASLIKLYVAGDYYEKVRSGQIQDTYGPQLDIMLSQSDNNAANTLIDLLGMDSINAFAEKIGASDTKITRKMLEETGTENYTSAADCGLVLEQVLLGTYVDQEASDRILADLKNQQRTWKIPAGVPEGVVTANKTGELSYVENDAAIVWAPGCTYILCVMSENAGDMNAAQEDIREISGAVYSAVEAPQ